MSDPQLEEDSLISQEDIDKLMSPASEKDEVAEGPDDDLGELSQDDIDSLMNSNIQGGDEDGDIDAGDEDDMVLISQNDIDSLINTEDDEEPATKEPDAEDVDPDDTDPKDTDDDQGELSQDDIDSLMNFDPEDDAPEVDENLEMISQDDINQLMVSREKAGKDSSKDSLSTPENSVTGSELGLVPDISGNDGGWTIEESEAVEAGDCEVTQETLDQLAADFDPSPDIEPVILDDETEPDASESDEGDFEGHIGELEEDSGDVDSDFSDDEDVTQEDIDALLMADDDEGEEDEDILISQDDIDTLLMAADEDDEDVLGNLVESDDEDGLDDDFEDDDFLDIDDMEDFEDTDDLDPVILKGDDKTEKSEKVQKESSTLKKPDWLKSKLVIACAAALIFLGISVPISYFLFFDSNKSPESSTASMTTYPVNDIPIIQEPEIEIVDVVVQQAVPRISGNILLKDFIVLAPDQVKTLNYVSVDISIDYSDQQASQEILDNIAFYRGLIYDSIKDKLALALDQAEVTQADIQTAVEDTLKRVIPGEMIDRVSLISFKTS